MPIFTREPLIDGKQYIDLCRFRHYPLEVLKARKCTDFYVCNIEKENALRMKLGTRLILGKAATFVTYKHAPSILDFSEKTSKINYKRGFDDTCRVLERKLG